MSDRARFFNEERWTGGVVGLGYVGLPLAVTMVGRGLKVIGFDVSERHVAMLRSGVSHIEDVADADLQEALSEGLMLTSDPEELAAADALLLCVPSPLGRNREPDLSYIHAAAATVAQVIRPGMLVALESTTYPGTTEDILIPAATSSGLVLDEDVFVAFSPERVDPGSDMKTGQIPKVVGGVSERSTQVARAAYERIVDSVYAVSSARTAEMAKLLENTYRAVNIGLINEMAQLAARTRDRHLGGHRRRVVEALRFSALLPRAGGRWALHPARSPVPRLACQRGQVRHPLHRPGRAGQHRDAEVHGGTHRRAAQSSGASRVRDGGPRSGYRLQTRGERRQGIGLHRGVA